MIDTLFSHSATVARHRAAPLIAERERFLVNCAERGYNRTGLRKIAWMLLVISSSLFVSKRKISVAEIEHAARHRGVRFNRHKAGGGNCPGTQQLFVRIATAWFDFLGRLEPKALPRSPFAPQIEAFERFMREERGLSAVTIFSRVQRTGNFLISLHPRVRSVEQITVLQVDRYLVRQSDHGWTRASLATLASDLRSFFRYAEAQHWCKAGIAAAIDSPRLYSDEGLPRGPDWEQVQALIASTAGDGAVAIRDRAIVMLLALYGLRRGEVARLRLEDIDWEAEVIRIVRPKQRRIQHYPLIRPVGDALVRYLREVRSRCDYREVFLAMKAPLRPLSPESITAIVHWRLAELGVDIRARGAHALRHACAGHLLEQGFSLKQIGDQLGHRRASSTRQYTKIDLNGLRQVAELDLGWLL